jgi:hypothetical protein
MIDRLKLEVLGGVSLYWSRESQPEQQISTVQFAVEKTSQCDSYCMSEKPGMPWRPCLLWEYFCLLPSLSALLAEILAVDNLP